MDPIIPLLRRNTQEKKDPILLYDQRFTLQYYDTTPIIVEGQKAENDELYGAKDIYATLLTRREQYGKASNYSKIRLLANPFENISAARFLNRAALKMASIRTSFPEIVPNRNQVKIAMLAEAPGAMLEYLMWYIDTQSNTVEVTAISLAVG